jgi:hypothetical protein
MKRIVFVIVLIHFTLFSHENTVVEIEAKIFPQILLFDTKISDKKIDGVIEVVITGEAHQVALFITTAKQLYPSAIKGSSIHFSAMKPREVNTKTPMSALVFLGDDSRMIETLSPITASKNILMFVDDVLLFRYGGAISLEVGNKVKPLLNSRVMKENKVIFSSGFIALARIVND